MFKYTTIHMSFSPNTQTSLWVIRNKREHPMISLHECVTVLDRKLQTDRGHFLSSPSLNRQRALHRTDEREGFLSDYSIKPARRFEFLLSQCDSFCQVSALCILMHTNSFTQTSFISDSFLLMLGNYNNNNNGAFYILETIVLQKNSSGNILGYVMLTCLLVLCLFAKSIILYRKTRSVVV